MQPGVDALVERANATIARYARLGSALALVVAVLGVAVAGGAELIGIAALGGGEEKVWVVIGGLLLAAAVVPPLVASVRLRAIPRHTGQLATDLRAMFDAGGEARAVVIETTEAGAGSREVVTSVAPMGRLRAAAIQSGAGGHLSDVAATLMSLPALLAIALGAMCVSAITGFILLLVWIA